MLRLWHPEAQQEGLGSLRRESPGVEDCLGVFELEDGSLLGLKEIVLVALGEREEAS